jgi:hypothetical protein
VARRSFVTIPYRESFLFVPRPPGVGKANWTRDTAKTLNSATSPEYHRPPTDARYFPEKREVNPIFPKKYHIISSLEIRRRFGRSRLE